MCEGERLSEKREPEVFLIRLISQFDLYGHCVLGMEWQSARALCALVERFSGTEKRVSKRER